MWCIEPFSFVSKWDGFIFLWNHWKFPIDQLLNFT
jgi:hypothetical protein